MTRTCLRQRLARVVDAAAAELRRQLNALTGGPPVAAAASADALTCDPSARRRRP